MSGTIISTLVAALISAGISAVVSLVVVGTSPKRELRRNPDNKLNDTDMAKGRMKKIAIMVCAFVVVIIAFVVVDKLNFVARWFGHLEPYKNSIERVFYFCVLVAVLILFVWKNRQFIKSLKFEAVGFGFLVELLNEESTGIDYCKRADVESSVSNKGEGQGFLCRGREREMTSRILSRLNEEMSIFFVENTILKRGQCRYRPDGFAVKNSHAYIVEVKVGDQPYLLDRAIQQLKMFVEMVPNRKLTDVTVILCLVTNRPISEFKQRKEALLENLNLDFIFRVFKPSELENI